MLVTRCCFTARREPKTAQNASFRAMTYRLSASTISSVNLQKWTFWPVNGTFKREWQKIQTHIWNNTKPIMTKFLQGISATDGPSWVVPRLPPTNPNGERLLLLHPPGTLYLLTFDCTKTFSFSNATWKPIYSNLLSPHVLHQAPLYLRT